MVTTDRTDKQMVSTRSINKFCNPVSDLAAFQAQKHLSGLFPDENDAESYLKEMRNAIQNCTF